MPNEYSNEEVGTVYLERAKDVDEKQWEVWFEDFNIIGIGSTRVEALQDAVEHCEQLGQLVKTALASESDKKTEPYKGPINQPCSACSAGDTAMEYHDHDYVKLENRR